MKLPIRILFSVYAVALPATLFAQTGTPQEIIDRLSAQQMTIYTSIEDFRPDDLLTRGEAAKMITNYAKSLGLSQDYQGSCTFDDIQDYDNTLVPHIITSCQYGLLKGGNGLFTPNGTLTQAQALVLIQRARSGFEDETGTPRYKNYFDDAIELSIVESNQLESVATTPITRFELGVRLYRASLEIQGGINNANNQTVYIPQGAVAPPPIVIRGTQTPSSSSPVGTSYTRSNKNETQVAGSYSWSFNYDTYQPYTDATLQLELAAGKDLVLFFGSQSSIQSRALDTNIKQGVRGNVSILFVAFDSNSGLKSTYGVTTPHTLVYLDGSGNSLFKTVSTDMSVREIIENIKRGGPKNTGTKI